MHSAQIMASSEPPPIRSSSLQQQQQQQQQHQQPHRGGGPPSGSSHLGVPRESSARRKMAGNHPSSNEPHNGGGGGGGGGSAGGSTSYSGGPLGRRPVKVWNASRTIRKSLVVSTYDEFQRKGRDKLGLGKVEPVRIVLEADGTQVDDPDYFGTLPENSIFLFLRPGECWHPSSNDSVKAVMEAIPSVVCDTLYAMGLHDQVPAWKIMDNRSRITVVLHWEKEPGAVALAAISSSPHAPALAYSSRQSSLCSTIASGGPRHLLGVHTRSISQRSGSGSISSTPCLSRDNSRASASGAIQHHSMLVQTSFDAAAPIAAPHITVINHDEARSLSAGSSGSAIITGAPSPRQLSRQGSSIESTAQQVIQPIHHHTAECAGVGGRSLHQPTQHKQRGSPTSNECDFHCCSLHRGAPPPPPPVSSSSSTAHHHHHHHHHQQSSLQKTVATSPIQETQQQVGETDGKRSLPKGAHVRFSEGGKSAKEQQPASLGTASVSSSLPAGQSDERGTGSSAGSSTTATTIITTSKTAATAATTANGATAVITATTTSTVLEPTLRRSRPPDAALVSASIPMAAGVKQGMESSESETENNDDMETAKKFLLLIDQLTAEQPCHLSIKDIGVILERLSAKIVDVERLEREKEDEGAVHNWTIKATIKGESMRELGVIYNSNYYSISEHPGYQSNVHDDEDDDEDEDEEDDDEEDDEPDTVESVLRTTIERKPHRQ